MSAVNTTLVIQSHSSPLPAAWLRTCLDSVRAWALSRGYEYRYLGDELFDTLAPEIWEKTRQQRVVAADLARLQALRGGLDEGFETVIWCDADMLIFEPGRFELPDAEFGLGREVWIQSNSGSADAALRAYVKVHNAFMFYRKDNYFLDFYRHSVERLLRSHPGPFVPQFAGPKFLTAIHNIVQCPVVESAGMLCPLVIRDLLIGGGPALDLFRQQSPQPLAAANLCASLSGGRDVSDQDIEASIELLLGNRLQQR